MKFIKKVSLFVFIFLLCAFLPSLVKADDSLTVEAPVIISADLNSPHARWGRPIVVGLIEKGTDALIYIDGGFAGIANVNESKTETNNFYFQPVVPLKAGKHTISVLAKDRQTEIFSVISDSKVITITALPAPTVYEPNENTITGHNRPLISGLTKSDTRALVYIDGVFNGKTDFITHQSGTAGFVYKPFLHLNEGEHTYYVIAESNNGIKSVPSRMVTFNIEKKYPAPTLIEFDESKKLLTGLARNDSIIKVYLDNHLTRVFKVDNHKSGTANFAITLQTPLTNDNHIVYAVSIDDRGKESSWSNIKTVNTATVVAKLPVISREAASESVLEGVSVTENQSGTNNEVNREDKSVNEDVALNQILNATTTDNVATQTSGLVDEKKNNQSKLKINVVIFILFLVALVAWIFWVNRELIKEKANKEKE